MRPRPLIRIAGALATLTTGAIAAWLGWAAGAYTMGTILIVAAGGWLSAARCGARAVAVVELVANRHGLFRFALEPELGQATKLEGAT